MFNHAPSDYDCPLCHIAKGEPTARGNEESTVIFRNDMVTVFIAGRFLRSNPGHVIIIPNEHFENVFDLPEEYGHAIFDASKKVSLALKEVYKCGGVFSTTT
jgi:histidine triad (HIT) family protein